jgi:hypothetical protein
MATTVDIGTLIERSPEVRPGRPCITGTGVTVRRIAGWHTLGLTPEEIDGDIASEEAAAELPDDGRATSAKAAGQAS